MSATKFAPGGESNSRLSDVINALPYRFTERVEVLKDAHGRYPNHDDGFPYDEVLLYVQDAVAQFGSLGKYEIGALLLWKRLNLSARWTRDLNNMPDREVRDITGAAVALARDSRLAIPEAARAARDALTKLPGCRHGHAVASTILTAGAPHRMAIYDRRAIGALDGLGCPNPKGNYGRYMATVVALVAEVNGQELSWCPRDVDKALYMLADS